MLPLPELLWSQDVDGPALANTTTPTSILHSSVVLPFSALWMDRDGKRFTLRGRGRVSSIATTPGTLTLDLKLGAIVIASSGALSLNTVAKTNTPWWLDWDLTLRSRGNGTLGSFMHQGRWESHSVIGSPAPTAGGAGTHVIPYNAAPAVGNGFDSTATALLDLIATWSIANAGNSIQVHQADLLMWN